MRITAARANPPVLGGPKDRAIGPYATSGRMVHGDYAGPSRAALASVGRWVAADWRDTAMA